MKKIIPSICMLLVTAVLMGTSTYAWFSMNRVVKATGMQVTASTSANLIISETDITNFSTVDAFDINFNDDAVASLAPVSSKDGKDFYTTTSQAQGNGNYAVKDGAVFTSVTAGSESPKYYYAKDVYIGVKGVSDLGSLKVEPTVTANKKGESGDTSKKDIYSALRFAVYYTTRTESAADVKNNSLVFAGDLTARSGWNPVVKAGTLGTTTDLTEVGSTTAVTAGTGIEIPSLTALTHEVSYKITIVFWLDGQDTACTANNANIANINLTGVTIDFKFTATDK